MNSLVEPAIVVAATALAIEAVKAVVELVFELIGVRESRASRDVSSASVVLALIDSLAVESGKKVVLKKRVIQALNQPRASVELKKLIGELE